MDDKVELSEAHKTWITQKYGFDPESFPIFSSVNSAEIMEQTGCVGITSNGIKINYPNHNGVFTIRLEQPHSSADGHTRKYIKPAGQDNVLFIPPGVSLDAPELLITEGEMKALAGSIYGLNITALSGIWNWRRSDPSADHQLNDREALIEDLNRDWSGRDLVLIYDSDIDRTHKGWMAYPRLAEQLYRLGAHSVKIVTLPD